MPTQYLMWFVPLFFFAYQFILRLWPGLMMQPIMEQFAIDATSFGMLAAFYYYGYAGMQIPVAILLDRYGPRRILGIFAGICGLAALLFMTTDNFAVALLSRALIGAGSAVGFLGISKVVSEWFPKQYYARMISFSFTFGLLGAVYGGKPVAALIEIYGWRVVGMGLGVLGLAIGLGAFLFLRGPARPATPVEAGASPQLGTASFLALLKMPLIWLLAIANLLLVGALEGFADVWGVPYLMTAFDIAKSDAAGLVSFVFIGMLFGGPVLAFCSQRLGNYPVIASAGIGMAIAFVYLFSMDAFHYNTIAVLLFVVGMLCCYQVLVFAAGSELVSGRNLGVTVAFLNCINMFGGSFFHSGIGRLMDLFWDGALSPDATTRTYSLIAYKSAMTLIPVCAALGVVLVFLVQRLSRRLVSQEQD